MHCRCVQCCVWLSPSSDFFELRPRARTISIDLLSPILPPCGLPLRITGTALCSVCLSCRDLSYERHRRHENVLCIPRSFQKYVVRNPICSPFDCFVCTLTGRSPIPLVPVTAQSTHASNRLTNTFWRKTRHAKRESAGYGRQRWTTEGMIDGILSCAQIVQNDLRITPPLLACNANPAGEGTSHEPQHSEWHSNLCIPDGSRDVSVRSIGREVEPSPFRPRAT